MRLNYIAYRKSLAQIKPLFDELESLREHCAQLDRLEGFQIIEKTISEEMKADPKGWLESLNEVGNAEARLLIAVEWLAGKQLISGRHDFPLVEGKFYKSGNDLMYLFYYSLDRLVDLGNITNKQKKQAIKELDTERNKPLTVSPEIDDWIKSLKQK